MARTKKAGFDEKALSKGELRKLTALRKSLGEEIANAAFAQWLATEGTAPGQADKNAEQIVEALGLLIEAGKLRIPRGGYILRRGRGRVIVERPA